LENTTVSEYQLTLYHFTGCPYCTRVRQYLKQNNIVIPEKNIRQDGGARQELIEAGGKGQVPALMIDGDVLYESTAIVCWVEQNLLQPVEVESHHG
jgi:glutaredoxin